MPVLMNKGDNPRLAAWIFYTDRDTFAAMGQAIRDGRMDAGLLVVDDADVESARKASDTLPVYLQATAVVPPEVDLEALEGQALTAAQRAAEEQARAEEADGGEDVAKADGGEEADQAAEEPEAPYVPVEVPEGEGERVRVGTTTVQAARDFILRRELGEEPWKPELPGVQAIAGMARLMDEHGGIPAWLVWHEDADGVMRMAPAKAVKPMAGNILKVKL